LFLAIKHQGELKTAAFLVWQRDFDRPVLLKFEPFLEQVRVTTIEFLIGVSFASLRDADALQFGAMFDEREGTRYFRADSAKTRSAAITFPGDIII
jgi:endonuclease G